MQSFIVLGLVPGTNFQLTFGLWLLAAGALLSLPVLAHAWRRRRQIHVYFVGWTLGRFIARCQLPA